MLPSSTFAAAVVAMLVALPATDAFYLPGPSPRLIVTNRAVRRALISS
jgi:hypothetical protein